MTSLGSKAGIAVKNIAGKFSGSQIVSSPSSRKYFHGLVDSLVWVLGPTTTKL